MGLCDFAIEKFLNANTFVNKLGQVQNIHLDRNNKKIEMNFLFHEELFIRQFEIFYTVDENNFVVLEIKSKTEWINAILKLWFQKKKEFHISLKNNFFTSIAKFFL